ncbi:beta-galactosidase [Brachybacterium sp. DNPG3]
MTPQPFAPPQLLFGGDYNPEQWPREVWAEDVELMRRARVNTVTLGVFSWSKLEPTEGVYDFSWLDEAIALLTEAGVGFLLSTPTASPPPWFTLAHPEAMPVRPDGSVLAHGSRDTYAISAPAYREASRRIARALAEHYGEHPGLRGWHVHNEYGTLDYGPHAAAAFRTWLQARYGDIDALNAAWTTAFWSQRYNGFEEVLPPRDTQYLHNPAHAVDFRRFCSDEMLAAMAEQRDEIRANGSRAPITTNFMLPTWNHLEQWSWADELDVVSIDHYLDTPGPDGETHVAYGSDLTRSWAGGPWVLMEQNARGIITADRTYAKSPDRMIRNALGYIARGAQSALFFQWRASAGGAEQWHGALVPHAGGDDEQFESVVELGRILEAVSEVTAPPADGILNPAEIGILWHADSWWTMETPTMPHDGITYRDEVRSAHRAFWRAGLATDFVRPLADVSRYSLLVVPALIVVTDEVAAWLRTYVEAGGRLVVTYLSGLVDEHQRVGLGGYPAALRDLLGIRVTQHLPLAEGEAVALSDGSSATDWVERVQARDADVLATYADGPVAGLPAVTEARAGSGSALYLSARLEQESRDRLLASLAEATGIAPVVPGAAERGVEAVRRRSADADHLFLLHHGERPVAVTAAGTDLVTGSEADLGLRLEPGGVAVLRVAPGAGAEIAEA